MTYPSRLPTTSLSSSALLLALWLAGCGGQPSKPGEEGVATPAAPSSAVPPAPISAGSDGKPAGTPKRGGGFYQDDGPLEAIPVDLATVPNATPRDEPLHRFANRPYSVLGRDYVPLQSRTIFRQKGVASWYGRKFHGQATSSGEPYDMFGMSAAHPTLPIPSYVRVTRPETGHSVVLRVNDRGPFLHDRIIDLSYTAAWKLGLVENGSGTVVVETVFPSGTTPAPATRLATAPPTPAPRLLRDIQDKSGHYLQLGAFGSQDNAESMRLKLARTLGELGGRLRIRGDGALYRLQLGPWADIAEARRVAEQLKSAFELPSILVK